MSYERERVSAAAFGLPDNFSIAWEHIPTGIRWVIWCGDEMAGAAALPVYTGADHAEQAREIFWDIAERYLAKKWDQRIAAAATKCFPAPAPLALPAAVERNPILPGEPQ